MKTRPVGAELFHAVRRTNMTKLTVALRNFAYAPRNVRQANARRLALHQLYVPPNATI